MQNKANTSLKTINQLNIVKGVDSASTGLMSALRNNDLIKKAVLTVRKAGKSQHEYFKITIENGRITSLDVRTAASNGKPGLMESLRFCVSKGQCRLRAAERGRATLRGYDFSGGNHHGLMRPEGADANFLQEPAKTP